MIRPELQSLRAARRDIPTRGCIMPPLARWLKCLCIMLALLPVAARGQALEDYLPPDIAGFGTAPGVTVASRLRPAYDPSGVRAGSFIIRPRLDLSLGGDSNVTGSTGGSASLGTVVAPAVSLAGDWARQRLLAYAGATSTQFGSVPSQNFTDWVAALAGGSDVGRGDVSANYAHLSLHQLQTQIDVPASDTPIPFRVDSFRAAATWRGARLSVRPDLAWTLWRYSPAMLAGQTVSQAYRNRDVLQGGVTLRYALAGLAAAVVVIRAASTDYVDPAPGQPSENSTGYDILAGLVSDGGVWRYRLLAGYAVRYYASSYYGTHAAPVAEAEAEWNPTGLTTLTGTLSRTIEDSATEGTGAYTYTRARLVVDHEYRRNLLLQLRGSAQQADYLRTGGNETLLGVGAGITWLIDRHFRLGLDWDFTDRHGTGGPYQRNVALLRLKAGL
jgi:hypothetical protein